ncbi:MAG: FHA domain-containing protein [Chloroflexota bacterium]
MPAFLIFNNQVFKLMNSSITIGRSLENNVVIQEPSISRRHARIDLHEKMYTIYDLGSMAGTFLNNNRVKQAVVKSGDSILIANIPLVFVENTPGLEEKAKKDTGPLKKGKIYKRQATEPTVLDLGPNWRPNEDDRK